MTLGEGRVMVSSLLGAKAHLCQVEAGGARIFNTFDPNDCQGESLELELVAVTLVERGQVGEFTGSVMNTLSWLRSAYPDAGFENVTPDSGMLLVTCVGQYYDQARPIGDETPSYQFNRLVLGFRIK